MTSERRRTLALIGSFVSFQDSTGEKQSHGVADSVLGHHHSSCNEFRSEYGEKSGYEMLVVHQMEQDDRQSSQTSASSGNKLSNSFRNSLSTTISTEVPASMSTLHEQVSDEPGVTIKEAVKSIVDNDASWEHMRKELRQSKIVTSLGIYEVCNPYIQEKAEEIKKQRITEQKLVECQETKYSKLRRRLTMF